LRVKPSSIEIRESVPLAPLTSFRVGGPARYFCQADTLTQLRAALDFIAERDLPFFVLGKGSNVLVADDGYPGMVLALGRDFMKAHFDGVLVVCGGAYRLPVLAREAARRSCAGLEWAVGIPGTVGGAVAVNAGAHGSDMANAVTRVTLLRPNGQLEMITREKAGFVYRGSNIKGQGIVLEAELRLLPGARDDIEAKMAEYFEIRKRTQPVGQRTAGSVFKNPPGEYAARLIQRCGLKGARVGGAMVSHKHANFIVNTGYATARDIVMLIRKIQEEVKEKTGVELETEIDLVGDFS
jgi:UDP-N-acetylmuramate dehydrogenase